MMAASSQSHSGNVLTKSELRMSTLNPKKSKKLNKTCSQCARFLASTGRCKCCKRWSLNMANKKKIELKELQIRIPYLTFNDIKALNSTKTLNSAKTCNSAETSNNTKTCNSAETFNNTKTCNSAETLNKTKTLNSVKTSNSAETFNNTKTCNSAETFNNTRRLNSAQTLNSTKTLNSAETFNSTKTLNSAETLNKTKALNSVKTCNSAETFNSTKTCNSAETFNSTRRLNSAQTLNSTKTLNSAETFNSTKTCNSAETLNKTKTLNSVKTCNSAETFNSTKTCNSAETLNNTKMSNSAETFNSTRTLNSAETSTSTKTLNSAENLNSTKTLNSVKTCNSAETSNSTKTCNSSSKVCEERKQGPSPQQIQSCHEPDKEIAQKLSTLETQVKNILQHMKTLTNENTLLKRRVGDLEFRLQIRRQISQKKNVGQPLSNAGIAGCREDVPDLQFVETSDVQMAELLPDISEDVRIKEEAADSERLIQGIREATDPLEFRDINFTSNNRESTFETRNQQISSPTLQEQTSTVKFETKSEPPDSPSWEVDEISCDSREASFAEFAQSKFREDGNKLIDNPSTRAEDVPPELCITADLKLDPEPLKSNTIEKLDDRKIRPEETLEFAAGTSREFRSATEETEEKIGTSKDSQITSLPMVVIPHPQPVNYVADKDSKYTVKSGKVWNKKSSMENFVTNERNILKIATLPMVVIPHPQPAVTYMANKNAALEPRKREEISKGVCDADTKLKLSLAAATIESNMNFLPPQGSTRRENIGEISQTSKTGDKSIVNKTPSKPQMLLPFPEARSSKSETTAKSKTSSPQKDSTGKKIKSYVLNPQLKKFLFPESNKSPNFSRRRPTSSLGEHRLPHVVKTPRELCNVVDREVKKQKIHVQESPIKEHDSETVVLARCDSHASGSRASESDSRPKKREASPEKPKNCPLFSRSGEESNQSNLKKISPEPELLVPSSAPEPNNIKLTPEPGSRDPRLTQILKSFQDFCASTEQQKEKQKQPKRTVNKQNKMKKHEIAAPKPKSPQKNSQKVKNLPFLLPHPEPNSELRSPCLAYIAVDPQEPNPQQQRRLSDAKQKVYMPYLSESMTPRPSVPVPGTVVRVREPNSINKEELLKNAVIYESVRKKTYEILSDLLRYEVNYTRARPYTCNVCKRTFIDKGALKKHMLGHAWQKTFRCDVCETEFSHESFMKKHKGVHGVKKQHKCSVCCEEFRSKFILTRHMSVHIGQQGVAYESGQFECGMCGMKFWRKISLRRHIIEHGDEKRHECEVCRKSFMKMSNLRRHAIVHTGEKAFECKVCGRKLSTRSSLQCHMLVHNKEFKCDVCGKMFATRKSLARHASKHAEVETCKSEV